MGGVNKRDHLIKTGQEVIWSKGYDLSSVKDITAAAGLPKGSFYHYFESKEQFALEAMKAYVETYPELLPQPASGLSAFEKLIDKRIESVIKFNFARECYMSVMCHAFSEQEDDFRLEILASITESNNAMRDLLEELKKQGSLREGLELDEMEEFIDFSWRGARLKARMLKSDKPLLLFKKHVLNYLKKD